MDRLTRLKKQRTDVIAKLKAFNTTCVMESRTMTKEEERKCSEMEKELAYLEQEIKEEKQTIRNNCIKVSSETDAYRKDESRMLNFNDKLKNELKRNEGGLVDLTHCEVRANTAGTVTGNTKVETPVNFLDQVFMDAVHDNLLLSMCNVIQTASDSKVLVGQHLGEMAELAEMAEITDADFQTTMKEIFPKRYGVANTISRLLAETSSFDVASHVSRLFSRSLASTSEGIIARALDADEDIAEVASVGAILKAIVGELAVMPENLRANSVIVMSPSHYKQMLLEEDGNGRNMLDFQFENSLRAKICACPVIVSEKVANIYVGSLKDAFTLAVNMNRFESENKPRANAVSFYLNVYMGGTVVLPNAVKRIKVTA